MFSQNVCMYMACDKPAISQEIYKYPQLLAVLFKKNHSNPQGLLKTDRDRLYPFIYSTVTQLQSMSMTVNTPIHAVCTFMSPDIRTAHSNGINLHFVYVFYNIKFSYINDYSSMKFCYSVITYYYNLLHVSTVYGPTSAT